MSKTYTHNCMKCQESYQDTDQDPYYCEACKVIVKKIAEEVDKKIASMPSTRTRRSALQEYDASEKIHGFVRA